MPAKDYFYYIDTTGYCTNGNFQLNTVGKSNYAKICAWKPSLPNVVYGCDAKGGVCWTSPSTCITPPNIGNASLGDGFQSCTRPSGSNWCCRDDPVERCGVTSSEPFTCWANDLDDDNPMRQVEGGLARNPERVRKILSSMGLTISSPTATPTFPASNTGSMSAASTGNANTILKPPQNNDPSFSNGAIAGAVIGALVGLGLLILGAVFILRHRKHRSIVVEPEEIPTEISAHKSSVNELSETRAMYELAVSECAELSGPRANQRHEIDS